MKVDGRCHCGAITFEAEIDPARITICHCTDCQMLTGTAFRTTVPAPAATFVLRSGTPKTYLKTTANSGTPRLHAFCGNCGTPLYATAVQNATTYGLRIGTLTQREQLRPARQIWSRSALPWSRNLEGIPASPRE